MSSFAQAVLAALPDDHASATLAGRVWRPDVGGPSVVAIRNGEVFDITDTYATMRDLCEEPDPAAATRAAKGESLGPVSDVLANTPPENRNPAKPWLLAPIQPGDDKPRWRLIPSCIMEPITGLTLPVRDIRVLYGLQREHYTGFARNQVPQPHEYFCPMEALTAHEGHENPSMRSLIARASMTSAFMDPP
jgi:hypothetical protein